MANQKMVRVDYRLIHGQIVAKWIKFRPVDRLIIADDELLNDEFMIDIYKMAVPGNEVDIVKVEDLEDALNSKDDHVMIIFKDVVNAKRAVDNGVELTELNVGAVQNNKERFSVTQGVALSKEEYESLSELKNNGLNVYIQPIPENDKLSLKSIKNKIK